MKSLIIYHDVSAAVRACAVLRCAASRAKVRARWDIKPWRVDVLRLPLAADEAMREALDADLIVLAGPRVYSLPPWLNQWLESWANRRQAGDCALVVVREATDGKGPAPDPKLSLFAERHGLDFIVERDTSCDDEMLSSVLTLPEDESPVDRTPQAEGTTPNGLAAAASEAFCFGELADCSKPAGREEFAWLPPRNSPQSNGQDAQRKDQIRETFANSRSLVSGWLRNLNKAIVFCVNCVRLPADRLWHDSSVRHVNQKALEVTTKLNKAMQVFIPSGGFSASPRPESGEALLTQEQVQITFANRQNYFR
jgi:hypothetical protein